MENTKHGQGILEFVRILYLSIASGIGLVTFVIGAVIAVRLLLLTTVFGIYENYVPISQYDRESCRTYYSYTENPAGKQINRTPEEAEKCIVDMEEQRRQESNRSFKSSLAEALAMSIIGLPVWLLHFMIMQADWKRHKQ